MLKKILFFAFVLLVAFVFVIWNFRESPMQRVARSFPGEGGCFDFGRALVVYYSLQGNTEEVALGLAHLTGADLYEIETARRYPATPKLYLTAYNELRRRQYPALSGALPEVEGYDTVFVGAPVWWFTVPPPMRAFLERFDFADRRVVPFCTSGGNEGDFFAHFEEQARNARTLPGRAFAGVAKQKIRTVERDAAVWLEELQDGLR